MPKTIRPWGLYLQHSNDDWNTTVSSNAYRNQIVVLSGPSNDDESAAQFTIWRRSQQTSERRPRWNVELFQSRAPALVATAVACNLFITTPIYPSDLMVSRFAISRGAQKNIHVMSVPLTVAEFETWNSAGRGTPYRLLDRFKRLSTKMYGIDIS